MVSIFEKEFFSNEETKIQFEQILKNIEEYKKMKNEIENMKPENETDHLVCVKEKFKYIEKIMKIKPEKMIFFKLGLMQDELMLYISNDMLKLRMVSHLEGFFIIFLSFFSFLFFKNFFFRLEKFFFSKNLVV